MQWLNTVVDELIRSCPEGEIIVSSGVSPSGKYHIGTLREILTAEVVNRQLKKLGRQSRHIHVVDDLDVLRKIPQGLSADYEKYLGMPLCDIPAPDGSGQSYADYFVADLFEAAKILKLDMEIMIAHEKYREGFFVPAIEKTLKNIDTVRKILIEVSGRQLDEQWSPVQVMEDGYLKNRKFVKIDSDKKELTYLDKDGDSQTTTYKNGEVKLNWRIDWPARWWLLGVNAEPFGRDHAAKGGSYDTGAVLAKEVFGIQPPLPIPYHFINRTGQTKKMSKSAGDTINISELLTILPPEVIWFFMLRFPPDKQLFFDAGPTLIRVVDEFSELVAKTNKTDQEQQLIEISTQGVSQPTISSVPFSHLVASYQASLKNPNKTLDVIARTEHKANVESQKNIILNELKFIDNWLNKWAPADVKFELLDYLEAGKFNETQKQFLQKLAEKVAGASENADGEEFHKMIYDLKDDLGLPPNELFKTLYQALIGKDSGPRAGWFLCILPRDWLIKRLKMEA